VCELPLLAFVCVCVCVCVCVDATEVLPVSDGGGECEAAAMFTWNIDGTIRPLHVDVVFNGQSISVCVCVCVRAGERETCLHYHQNKHTLTHYTHPLNNVKKTQLCVHTYRVYVHKT